MIVYYSSSNLFFPIQQPKSILNDLVKNNKTISESNILKCPAVTEYYKNIYAIYPTFDYEIAYKNKTLTSPLYDQNFFEKAVYPRNIEKGIISYQDPPICFFSEVDSLYIETMPPFTHKITNNYLYVLGKYDVGKHLRPLEIPLILNDNHTYHFNTDTPLYYVKFNTEEKIIFKRFWFSDELYEMVDGMLNLRKHTLKYNGLEFFYNLIQKYNYKKKYLKLIKQNLID